MIEVGLGVATSLLTDLIKYVNNKLRNTALAGDGAFLVLGVVSIVVGSVKVFYVDGTEFSWGNLASSIGSIFAVANVYFTLIAKKLGINVVSKKE